MVPAEAVCAPCKACDVLPDIIAYPVAFLLIASLACLLVMLGRMAYDVLTGRF